MIISYFVSIITQNKKDKGKKMSAGLSVKPLTTNFLKRDRFDVSEIEPSKKQAIRPPESSEALSIPAPLQMAGWKDPFLSEVTPLLEGTKWIKSLGEGHFSQVKLIESPLFGGQPVAFKILPESVVQDYPKVAAISKDRIGGEGLALFLRGHKNLINTLGILVQDERTGKAKVITDPKELASSTIYGVFSEYVPEAITLEALTERLSTMPADKKEQWTKHIMRQIINAFYFMHQKGISYRDLKPDNILVNTKTGEVKILDFGLTRHLSSLSGRTSTMTGTAGYIAPEVYLGKDYNPFKADVFTLGILLHYLTFDEHVDWPVNEFEVYDFGKLMESYFSETDEGKGTLTPYLPDEAKDHPLATDLIVRLTQGDPEKRPSLLDIVPHPYFKK